jgi:hypothetical protein
MALPAPARILSPACLSDALIFQKALNDKLLPQSPMMSRLELAPGQLLARSESPCERSGTSPCAIRRGRERAIAPSFGLRG